MFAFLLPQKLCQFYVRSFAFRNCFYLLRMCAVDVLMFRSEFLTLLRITSSLLTPGLVFCWRPNRPGTVIWWFATWTREETRNGIICKSLKLLSPCTLSSRFTFAHRLLFHVTRATAYQAVPYAAEIIKLTIEHGSWSKKAEIISSYKPLCLERFGLISGINMALLCLNSFSVAGAMPLGRLIHLWGSISHCYEGKMEKR